MKSTTATRHITTLQDIKEDAETIGFEGTTEDVEMLCLKVFAIPERVYSFMDEYGISIDSVIREKIFSYLADRFYGGDYDKIYNQWLAEEVTG